jgi:phosphoenolpyruvate carboxykinase (ATP)
VNFEDISITENTRASYPLHYIPTFVQSGRAGHPKHVVFLTADAFGVLPPLARLTREQAMYYFLSGYTAKVAGTERGLKEPEATFSACFGAVFLVWHPTVYAEMLGKLLNSHGSQVWLVNTGWSGGPYGVGKRMKLGYTRAMVSAALNGALTTAPVNKDPIFNLAVPQKVEGVPDEVLNPHTTWPNTADYDAQAAKLAQMFAKNFERFAGKVDATVKNSGPHV